MSNQSDRFAGGFLAGTLFGGIVGGLLGTWIATSFTQSEDEADLDSANGPTSLAKEQLRRIKQRVFQPSDELSIDEARHGLEEKISQLNDAIDQARQQLSNVNGASHDS